MLGNALAFAAGAAMVTRFDSLPGAVAVLTTTGTVVLAAWRMRGWLAVRAALPWGAVLAGILGLVLWLAAGACWAWLHAHALLHASGLSPQARVETTVAGCVRGIPQPGAGATHFELAATQIAGRLLRTGALLRLSWFGAAPRLLPGDCLQLRVRIGPPRPLLNPGGFDRVGWLFRRGVVWQGYVRARLDAPTADAPIVSRAGGGLDRVRLTLAEKLRERLGERPATALVVALAVGLRADIDATQWQVLRETGTAHLLAVSGLHIGLVAAATYLLVLQLWCRGGALAERWCAPRVAALAALLAASAYAGLAGFAIPTQRALVMAAVTLGAVVLRRRLGVWSALGTALLVVVVLRPGAVLDPGAWLSFGAVAVLLHGSLGRPRGSRVLMLLRVQWLAALGLAPLCLLLFGEAPLLGALANAFAVPWTSALVVPLVLLGSALTAADLASAEPVLRLAALLIELMMAALAHLAALAPRFEAPGGVTPMALLCALLGVALLLAPRTLPGRWSGLLWLLPLLLGETQAPPPGQLRVAVLDVGQGLAVVLRTHRHAMVFDTGPPFGRSDAAWRALLPYLRHRGLRAVDVLMVSHPDSDHAGGSATLVANLPVARVLGEPGPRGPVAEPCVAGMRWRWDAVDFEVLHPGPGWRGSDNDRSCVLRVQAGAHVLLLPGDLEARGERHLLRRDRQALRADVLVASHHGSRSSSTAGFLAAVAPREVIFAAGRANRWGFPHAEVVARVQGVGARTWNTARDGAVLLDLGAPGAPRVQGHAGQARRFWHRQAEGGWRLLSAGQPVEHRLE